MNRNRIIAIVVTGVLAVARLALGATP